MIPLKDEVTVVSRTLDDWGRPVNGQPQTFKCRIDYTNEEIKTPNGETVVSRVVILIKGFANVTTSDSVSWEDELGTHTVEPVSVSLIKDLSSKILFTKVVI